MKTVQKDTQCCGTRKDGQPCTTYGRYMVVNPIAYGIGVQRYCGKHAPPHVKASAL